MRGCENDGGGLLHAVAAKSRDVKMNLRFDRLESGLMASAKKLLSLQVLIVLTAIATGFSCSAVWARHRAAHRYCDPETGDAVRSDIQALNRVKNRGEAPTTKDFDRTASLATMLQPGNDEMRWDTHKAAQLVGYVADVKMGGVETVNCHARSAHGRDTHIDLTLSPADAYNESKHVIVEVTPRWRSAMAAKGIDWETDTLRERLLGRCVRVSGWLLFDTEHRRESQNTGNGRAEVWRATAWEIHPVTAIELLVSCARR